jgi:hypothetical protein
MISEEVEVGMEGRSIDHIMDPVFLVSLTQLVSRRNTSMIVSE